MPHFRVIEQDYDAKHKAHDCAELANRWKRLAKRARFDLSVVAEVDGYDVLGVRTSRRPDGDSLYVSAGIHGDEPAGVWGLLEWCEEKADSLRSASWLLLPCLNPWGLANNRRADSHDRDLNRSFHLRNLSLIAGWRRFIGDVSIKFALMLHEDYDAKGVYAFHRGAGSTHVAKRALRACANSIPVDRRTCIDRFSARGGIIRMSRKPKSILGLPESRYLFAHHTKDTLVFESPSEFSLFQRVRAHKAVLDCVAKEYGKPTALARKSRSQ